MHRRLAGWLAAVAALLLTLPAQASEEGAPFPFELRLGLGWTRDEVSAKDFEGTHTLAGTATARTFRASGAQVGYLHPALFGAELEAAAALGGHLQLGLVGSAAVAGGPDGTADPSGSARAGDLREFTLAAAPGLRAELREIPLRFIVEARLGVRFESIPVLGLGMTDCTNASCTFDVNHHELFVQPQLRVDYRFGRAFAIGLFLAADAAPHPLGVFSGGLHMAVDSASF